MAKLLMACDFVKHTGFARVGESLTAELAVRGWDIAVLAVQHKGDYTPLQERYRLYPAFLGGDLQGVGRIAEIVRVEQPDILLLINDPWIIADYLKSLSANSPPAVVYTPVDGTNLRPVDVLPLNRAAQTIAYTDFGRRELRHAGLIAPCHVIPHGVDLDLFRPVDQHEARTLAGLPPDIFAVLVLDTNNPRKRLDIAFDAFRMFAEDKPDTVKLVYHGPLKPGGWGWDIADMARDLGIASRLVLTSRDIQMHAGIEADQMAYVYSMCDVKLSATSGEGWGLTTMEAMACGLPNIVPQFGALAEWAHGAVRYVEAPIKLRHTGGINTVGRAPTPEDLADALNEVYHHSWLRDELRDRGLETVHRPEYRWSSIAEEFDRVLKMAAYPVAPVVHGEMAYVA